MTETMRTHVVLPRELVERMDEIVGPRRRSEFVTEAVRTELDRRRLLELLDAAVEEAEHLPPDDDPPAWESAESAVAWVREQRRTVRDVGVPISSAR